MGYSNHFLPFIWEAFFAFSTDANVFYLSYKGLVLPFYQMSNLQTRGQLGDYMCYSNHVLPLIWEEACFTFSTDVKPLNLLITSSQVLMQKYLESIYVHSPELPPKKFPAKSKLSTIVIIQTHFSIDQTTKSNFDSNDIIQTMCDHHFDPPGHHLHHPDHHFDPP